MKIRDLVDSMDYNLSRSSRGESNLGNIEKLLIDLFFQKPKTDEQIKNFKANLFSNPNMFGNSIKYESVKGVDAYFGQQLIISKNYDDNQRGANIR